MAMPQGQPGIRGPATATPGGTIEVQVAGSDGHVDVSTGGPDVTRYKTDANGKVTVPVPPVPAGTVLYISVGRGLRRAAILVEVVEQE